MDRQTDRETDRLTDWFTTWPAGRRWLTNKAKRSKYTLCGVAHKTWTDRQTDRLTTWPAGRRWLSNKAKIWSTHCVLLPTTTHWLSTCGNRHKLWGEQISNAEKRNTYRDGWQPTDSSSLMADLYTALAEQQKVVVWSRNLLWTLESNRYQQICTESE